MLMRMEVSGDVIADWMCDIIFIYVLFFLMFVGCAAVS